MDMREEIEKAVAILRKGGIILYPTDTLWGVGCDATNEQAVAKVYALKKSENKHGMIVLMDSLDSVARYFGRLPDVAWELLEYATSPLTLILPGAGGVASNLLSGASSASHEAGVPASDKLHKTVEAPPNRLQDEDVHVVDSAAANISSEVGETDARPLPEVCGTAPNISLEASNAVVKLPNKTDVTALRPEERTLAVRIPDHEFCRQLLRRLGRPLVSTSANISGEPSPRGFGDIDSRIKDGVDMVIDQRFEGNPTRKASSIIKLGSGGQVDIIRE